MTAASFASLLVLACPLVALAAGTLRPAWAARAGTACAALAAAALAWAARAGDTTLVDVPWIPALGARLALGLDALAAPYAVLAAGLGALIVAYSAAYLPAHLAHAGKPAREAVRFHALLLAFLAAMVALVAARDLLVLYVALDLTALCSYFLIRFDGTREARAAARTAAVVTVGSSVAFLVGALLLGREHGTLAIDELARVATPGPGTTVAAALVAAGVLAKSAQFPLHVWLPRAMVAPTPVSAYLHSAALVAAGVFVLQRLHCLLELAPAVADVLAWVAGASIVTGSAVALVARRLKVVLAHSTVAQYGYVLWLVALGGDDGCAGAPLYVLVHGLCKSALFLAAGAVTLRTGIERLHESRGLARRMPVLAAATGVAAAGLAGLPLTAGYFADELFFAAAWAHGPAAGAAAAGTAALTLAYALRFWLGLFGGRAAPGSAAPRDEGPRVLTAPVVALAALVLALGLAPVPLAALARSAGAAVAGAPVEVELAYRAELRSESLLAAGAWLGGVLLALALARRRPARALGRVVAAAAATLGPRRWAGRAARGLDRASDALHGFEVRDLRDRVGAILLANAVFLGLGLAASAAWAQWRTGALEPADLPLALALAAAAGAALVVVRERRHLALVLMISFVGFALALAFAFSAAPDVALVAVLIETTFTLLFVALLARVPPVLLERAHADARRSRARDVAVAALAGCVACAVAWTALSSASPAEERVKEELVRRAGDAHAGDVVTAILTDFRGLDTAVEITVVVVALLGAAAVRRAAR